jgi:hypothetical protein
MRERERGREKKNEALLVLESDEKKLRKNKRERM